MATAGGGRGPGPERSFHHPLPIKGRVVLGRDESHHLVRVRRAREGEAVVLFDGAGVTRLARLVLADARAAALDVEGDYPDREPTRPLALAVSIPEGGRADSMVATLAELGVTRLDWLRAERTPGGRVTLPERRAKRWARLVREAAKVNGRSRLLVLGSAVDLATATGGGGEAVLLDPDPTLPRLADWLPGAGPLPRLLVGPEGGFTEAEVDAAVAAGVRRARLGTVALRTDTAAIAAAAVALA